MPEESETGPSGISERNKSDNRHEIAGLEMKPALLVVDVQNAWLDGSPELRASMERRLPAVNEAIEAFRKGRMPVIAIYHEDKERGVVAGARSFEFPISVEIRESDTKVMKRYPNSFCKTGLDTLLRGEGCDTVMISGLSASGCVLGTFFGALDCDLRAYLLKGGVASHSEDHVRFAEEVCDVMTLEEFLRALG